MRFCCFSVWMMAMTLGWTGLLAKEECIRRVTGEYMEAQSFERISEYFTCKENTGGNLIYRTDSTKRSGYYMILELGRRVNCFGGDTELVLRYVERGCVDEKELRIALDRNDLRGKRVYIGFTEDGWYCGDRTLMAWCLHIDSVGECSSRIASNLWGNRG